MTCRHCGKEIERDAAFCPYCGKAVGSAGAAQDDWSALTARAKAGEEQALTLLYERTYSQVYYTVRSMIKGNTA